VFTETDKSGPARTGTRIQGRRVSRVEGTSAQSHRGTARVSKRSQDFCTFSPYCSDSSSREFPNDLTLTRENQNTLEIIPSTFSNRRELLPKLIVAIVVKEQTREAGQPKAVHTYDTPESSFLPIKTLSIPHDPVPTSSWILSSSYTW
jgi:hypothetical protein